MNKIIQKAFFVLHWRYMYRLRNWVRKIILRFLGMQIGKNTSFGKLYITWPHKVVLGNNCVLEHDIFFKYDGIWEEKRSIFIGDYVFLGSGCEFNIRKSISIGKYSMIASGCRFIDHDHGVKAGELMGYQLGVEKEIKIGDDVWLGCNVIVLKGVEIGDGAIVAAGAVVTKCISQNEIWAGVPARKIGERT